MISNSPTRPLSKDLSPQDGLKAASSHPIKSWLKRHRIPILVVGHLGVFCLIYMIALTIRFETWFPTHNPSFFTIGLPFVALTKLAVFYALRNFHGWWRYVTFSDLLSLARAATVSLILIVLIDYLFIPNFQIPRSVIVIDWALSVAVLSGLRSICRVWDENISVLHNENAGKRALLVGNDNASAKLAHLINSRPALNVKIVGLVGADETNKGHFSNLKVIGSIKEIKQLAAHYRARILYVPTGALSGKDLRQLVGDARKIDLEVNVVPEFGDSLTGGTQIPIRKVKFEDLLRRRPVQLDNRAIATMISGKTVMVTGAGGSIGSEICRQLIKFNPARLILAGRGENRIYDIQNELQRISTIPIVPSIVTVTDVRRVDQLFSEHRPDIVFHAAAHKHVPLMEDSPGEAVVNNVDGTRIVADAAVKFKVSRFVLVSTDKAVNPTSVMGCTKQLAERYCLAADSLSDSKFVVTRFGNVLGSAGSVVPLFEEQIRRGGPITVTDPEMTRFFMTIPEASQLVLQAAAMGEGGEIFVLAMGEPVKIVDLAKDLIRFAGLSPENIEIEFTGIRPGEKLYEELYYREEESIPTEHKQIMSAYCRPFDFQEVSKNISELVSLAFADHETIKSKIKSLVPEYQFEPAKQTTS